jgi:hypothetical protein
VERKESAGGPEMKKLFTLSVAAAALLAAAAVSGQAWAASLQNTDNQSYDLILIEPGYRQDYRAPYQILSHARIELCFYGCEMIMRSTGQSVRIGPDEAVTISWGVMRVERSWRNTP